jgi:hypothetical protein
LRESAPSNGFPRTRQIGGSADDADLPGQGVAALVPRAVLMRSIERFWTEVMPRIA